MKKLAVVLLWFTASAALSAELKYTVKVEARKGTAVAEVDPMLAMLGNQILEAAAPQGSVELTITLGNGVARVEWSRAMPGIPAGAVLLQRRNGSRVMFSPANRTWWRVAVPNLYDITERRRAVITRTPSEETREVAGRATTRTNVEIVIPFPEAQAGEMVSGTPTELPLEGEVWITSSLAQYATPELRTFRVMGFAGFDIGRTGQFVLRQILRGPTFGEMELESIVTSISEEAVPLSMFEVPPGFKEVPTPASGG